MLIKNVRQKSICMVAGSYPKYLIGGAGLQLYLFGKELIKRGYTVHFTTYGFGHQKRTPAKDEGFIIHTLDNIVPIIGLFSRMLNIFQTIRPDILLCKGQGYHTLVALICAKLIGGKFVYWISSEKNCKPRRLLNNILTYLLTSPGQIAVEVKYCAGQWAMRHSTCIIAQAEYQRQLLQKNFGIGSFVIKNGHPLNCNSLCKDYPPFVLWLGSLKRLRRADLFIELASKLRDINCRFVLAGRPSDRGYLESLLPKIAKVRNLKYIGGVTIEQGNELLERASVFVNTSEYEGFPNTFVQAWIRKTPTVSLTVDPDDIIKTYELGFHSRTFEQFIKDVRTIIIDRELRKRMGKNAEIYAREEHNLIKQTDKLVALIETIKDR